MSALTIRRVATAVAVAAAAIAVTPAAHAGVQAKTKYPWCLFTASSALTASWAW